MTDPNRTHITAVLDRSGSMRNLAADTIGGFNKFLEDQKATEGEATLTLVLFDDHYDKPEILNLLLEWVQGQIASYVEILLPHVSS